MPQGDTRSLQEIRQETEQTRAALKNANERSHYRFSRDIPTFPAQWFALRPLLKGATMRLHHPGEIVPRECGRVFASALFEIRI